MVRSKKRGAFRGNRPINYSTTLVKENDKYEDYYNSLHIIPEDEKEEFWAALRRDLPNSFRFTGSKGHALSVQKRLKDHYVPNITSIRYEGELVEPPKPIEWYPDQLAWSMTTPKNVIRKFAPFASFRKFLVSETEVGNISRQEVVSMIPPLLMDVQPGMVILDMCAAPGSKAAQIMEMLHAGEEERMAKIAHKIENKDEGVREDGSVDFNSLLSEEPKPDCVDDDGRSTGLLIANDSEYKRAHLLIHQMKRLNSPNLIVTNHDATMYPSIKLPSQPGDDKTSRKRYLKFDRILADVPCSGDGTTRKNMNIWRDWNPSNALGLHSTQTRILARALQMLKVGGRVVYSTCSMNPVENEAVLASVIDRSGGSSKVEIVDCSTELPSLKRSPGLKTWTVIDKQGRIWSSMEEAQAAMTKDDPSLSRFVKGMFPPTNEDEGVDLTRCMRVYPHYQDTGGFFIAVLEKKSEIRMRPEPSSKAGGTQTPTASKQPGTKPSNGAEGMPAPAIVSGDTVSDEATPNAEANGATPIAEPVADLQQQDSVPSSTKRSSDHLDGQPETKKIKVSDQSEQGENKDTEVPATGTVQPTETKQAPPPKKQKMGHPLEEPFKYLDANNEDLENIFAFYKISSQFPRDRFMVRNPEGRAVKTIYYSSALSRDILTENEGSGIKFVHCGVKMFVRQDIQKPDVCPWRIQMDGLPVLESWVGKHRLAKMYKKETLRKLLVEMFPKVSDGGWKEMGEIGETARDMFMGCCILRLEPTDAEDGFRERMVLPLWRSLHSLNLMLPKEDRRALLLRLFDDDTPLINTTQKRNAAEKSIDESETSLTPMETPTNEPEDDTLPSHAEEEAIRKENLVVGQEEQDAMNARESYVMAGDEPDVMNTTV